MLKIILIPFSILILGLLVVYYCIAHKSGVEIRQEVYSASVLRDQNRIVTEVWVWKSGECTLEYWEIKDVSKNDIDSIKRIEYTKALPTYAMAKKAYENNN